VGAFALGATSSASAGFLAGRALEAAAVSCVVAGLVLLLVYAIRTRPRGKRHATGGGD
jgi:hypothetical protein